MKDIAKYKVFSTAHDTQVTAGNGYLRINAGDLLDRGCTRISGEREYSQEIILQGVQDYLWRQPLFAARLRLLPAEAGWYIWNRWHR